MKPEPEGSGYLISACLISGYLISGYLIFGYLISGSPARFFDRPARCLGSTRRWLQVSCAIVDGWYWGCLDERWRMRWTE
jgi:hypothetical protein